MSELIDNNRKKKELLKHMILQLHKGEAPEQVRTQLVRLMGSVPYGIVVEAEQELISEGLPTQEVLKLCDIHGEALKGIIDPAGTKPVPPGHPVHTFREENAALRKELAALDSVISKVLNSPGSGEVKTLVKELKKHIAALSQVNVHYKRKENLLFPFLEKYGITGPSTVMWGKDDETRELLKAAQEALEQAADLTPDELRTVTELVLKPAASAVDEMIYKEEEILFPMSLDTLSPFEWHQIVDESPEYGFCLFEPTVAWQPEEVPLEREAPAELERIEFPSGGFTREELFSIFTTLPVDLTFVDHDDRVRFFTQGKDRIFQRNRTILGRRVDQCHPPSSVHVVKQILEDFRSGKESRAAFWITLKDRFIHIEYLALRSAEGVYLGTIEVTQDLTQKKKLEGEQRLLNYGHPAGGTLL
jgi:hypothetical protein